MLSQFRPKNRSHIGRLAASTTKHACEDHCQPTRVIDAPNGLPSWLVHVGFRRSCEPLPTRKHDQPSAGCASMPPKTIAMTGLSAIRGNSIFCTLG